jgi:coatomer subunit gamma
VAETCNPDDVIIVTSSLTKVGVLPKLLVGGRVASVGDGDVRGGQDMNSKEDLYRANAIRVLSKIIDSTMLGAIDRCVARTVSGGWGLG